MKPSKGWAIVNKKSGEIEEGDWPEKLELEIYKTRETARNVKDGFGEKYSKHYKIVQVAIIPVEAR